MKLFGISYKKNTDDDGAYAALCVGAVLRTQRADVVAVYPFVVKCSVDDAEMVSLSQEEIESADAIVLLPDHDDFDYGSSQAL